jgi:hypothetical protein
MASPIRHGTYTLDVSSSIHNTNAANLTPTGGTHITRLRYTTSNERLSLSQHACCFMVGKVVPAIRGEKYCATAPGPNFNLDCPHNTPNGLTLLLFPRTGLDAHARASNGGNMTPYLSVPFCHSGHSRHCFIILRHLHSSAFAPLSFCQSRPIFNFHSICSHLKPYQFPLSFKTARCDGTAPLLDGLCPTPGVLISVVLTPK